ncbi:DNA-binding protein [Methylobacterium sp. J-092]|uniref:DNA-binding protein n=1 Tax=Methylobacterium sp. J-092 TaxID=2836667 RepID=UPI001FB8743E|nr:DNA-binding protein [Methylobacterium sp. J-092]MCJ2010446.1 DNA-binding protein [Methylobacterium sp. J-092]
MATTRPQQEGEAMVRTDDDLNARDLLYGMPTIAAHLGLKVPQARRLSDKGTFPTFKIGKLTCARR